MDTTTMAWIKNYACKILVVIALGSSMLWMNMKFNEIDKTLGMIKAFLVLRDVMHIEVEKYNGE